MTTASLLHWIEHPEELNRDTLYELRTQLVRYPYFQTLRLLYLKNLYLLHDSSFGAELHKSVLYVSDRRMLFYLIEGEKYLLQPLATEAAEAEWAEEPGVDRTLSLIDAFLTNVPKEPATHPDIIMDYAGYLLSGATDEDSGVTLRGQSLIDNFMEQEAKRDGQPGSAPHPKEPSEEAATTATAPAEAAPADSQESGLSDSYFTETLAKIYIKQQRYEKALEIIKKLSLNYPNKNSYFADQIRFLEKLIINAKSK